MDFARKQLEKYGWSDGKGLGKNENGISEALKPKLKRSVAGIGHDAAAEFTEHWWSELYNKASSNLEVLEKNGTTKKIKPKEEFEITNSTWKLKRKPKDNTEQAQYGDFFVKKAILASGGAKTKKLKHSQSDDDEPAATGVPKMTDEELFAACGGRTAHKGARHGLKASGKLARIEQQEKMLLTQTKYDGYSHKTNVLSLNDLQLVEDMNLNSDCEKELKKKRKKRRKVCLSEDNITLGKVLQAQGDLEERNAMVVEPEDLVTKKIKKKRRIQQGNCALECKDIPSEESCKKAKNTIVHNELTEEEVVKSVSNKKKKKRQRLSS